MSSKAKRKEQQMMLSLIDDYFKGMKETSELVDPIIVSCLNKQNREISKDGELRQSLHETSMGRIGKPKMRSYTARLGYEICSGENLENFLPIAAAMDLLEFSYYCSDKIFDMDCDRKIVEDKIIASHILTSEAFSLVGNSARKLNLSSEQTSEIISDTSSFIRDIYEGFFAENHNSEASREVYEQRTYAYNYWEHILKIAAKAANADREKINALSEFGKNIGMAYMVTNDISDIVKDFEDIKNGRYTLPNIFFLEKADCEEKKLFEKSFGNKSANFDDLKRIGKIMVDKEVVGECQAYAVQLAEKAIPYLRVFDESHPKKMLMAAAMPVYRNQWYRAMRDAYGYKRKISPPELVLLKQQPSMEG